MFGSRLSVSSRFMLVLVIGFVFQAGISAVSLLKLRQSLLRDRTAEVKHLLETAYSTVAYYHAEAVAGRMTEADAQKAAKDAVRAMRYDNNNYFFMWTMEGVGVAHGSHPEWEGRNMLQAPDATRFPVASYMVSRLIEVCRTPAREGVATYRIPKLGQTAPIDKIAYTRLFVPWGWSIGTGAYVDDIDATFRAQVVSLLWVFTGLISVASLITFLLGRDLSQAMKRLSSCVAGVAAGHLDGEVPEVQRRDEVGVMARALLVLRDNSREVVELRRDQLTGLPNRKLLMDRLKQALASSARSGRFGGLLLMDLDKFKALNDSQGHDAGDLLLQEVARRLTSCVRESDTVARLGGDEFVLVVLDIGQNEEDAAQSLQLIGDKILAVQSQVFQLGSVAYLTSVSIGATLFQNSSIAPEELLKQADLAMYKAKEAGRNDCRFFDPLMEATVRERAAMEEDLRLALERKHFELYYQPQIGPDGRLIGAEALIRWNHSQRGMVPPDAFIPLAEETGMIVPLGKWVLQTACAQMALWAWQPETADLRIAVNVSVREFQQTDFVDQLLDILEQTGANPHRLELELTESLLVEDVDKVIAKMLRLQASGVGFSLDDFGTGYSSLAYLKLMPLDQVKIDRSFVRDVLVDPNDATIARAIVALALALGLAVVAEGVETEEQRAFLAESGCDAYQGYLFSRPLPLQAFEKFVRNRAAASLNVALANISTP